MTPTSVVLLQELERFNKLIKRMAISLSSLQKVRFIPVCAYLVYKFAALCHLLPTYVRKYGFATYNVNTFCVSLFTNAELRILRPTAVSITHKHMCHPIRDSFRANRGSGEAVE